MSKSHIIPTMFALSPIEHPRCPRCQLRMKLVEISLGPGGRDFRRFECSKCSYTETAIADDPMKSEKAGWLEGELKPPQ
jgi:transposase-like protein